ncbi:hypothetical protein ScPMuIL_007990 [Solemya velum]
MSTYKLVYFNSRGRAELSRLAFAVGGIKYEDERLSGEEWLKLKPKTPQGVIPILEIDGKTVTQSLTIARYIGRQCDLMGRTPLEQIEVDCTLDTSAEVWDVIARPASEEDIIRKKFEYKNLMDKVLPKVLDYFEGMLAANSGGGGFLVGSALTLADLSLYDVMGYPMEGYGFKLDKYPKVAAHRQKVANIPKIAEYLKNSQKEDNFVENWLRPAAKQCSEEKRYKLIYFPTRGRAELTRLVFAASGIDYEDCRIDRQTEWPKIKPNTPLGQLPVLEVDGEQMAESSSIARFVAKQAGMMGKTSLEQAQIEMIVDALQDALETVVSWFVEKEESIKAEKKKKVVEETYPTVVSIMESILTKNAADGGFLVGSSMSLADLALYDGLQYPVDLFDFSLDKYPKTAAQRKMVAETPRIAEWLKKRPKTEY